MMQQHHSAETERYYSPEEAGEILKLAANLQDNAFSYERLRAIAAEAGISEENLQRAVQLYEQQRKQSLQSQGSKVARRRKNFKRLALYLALIVALLAGVMMSISVSWQTLPPLPASATAHSSVAVSGTLVASSEKCEVYKQRKFDEKGNEYEQVQIRDTTTGDVFVVGHRFGNVVSASISPTGKHVAIYDEEHGEVWAVATDGSSLQCVARRDKIAVDGNPIAGWYIGFGKELVKLRTASGYTYTEIER